MPDLSIVLHTSRSSAHYELWNLTVKNNDLAAYTQRFQELTMMCTKMVPEEEDQVEKFIGGLPDNIQGNVMAAPIISISSDLSEESVGSHAPRVILFGAIHAIIPIIPEVLIVPADPIVAPEVGTVLVIRPAGVLDLVDYSFSSYSDPSEDSLPPTPDLPLVSPFLCSDDSEADGKSEHAEQRPISSSYDTLALLSEFPLARRRVSHHSSDHHSSPDSSSSSSPSDHSLSGHTPPDTTNADSSTPQRFVHRSLARTP
ncbi:putative reverse transcriptase domain-containing protein [Tanacetum coccineum]